MAQIDNTEKLKLFLPGNDTLAIDSLSIVPESFQIMTKTGEIINQDCYHIDFAKAQIIVKENCQSDTIFISYRTFPLNFDQKHFIYNRKLIQTESPSAFDPFVYRQNEESRSYGLSELNKSGSISRGIAFGNSQDLSVNSTLNLQLNGKITPEINVLASITDDNLPIQPQGNTQQLQDFDRVYIQLYNDKSKLTAGDFQLKNRDGYFLKYFKRAQGATFETKIPFDNQKSLLVETSAAVSKGKFARNLIQGIEGNQGPYRLRGAENERFIVVLAGTERVYIDGRLMQRGQEFDYIIDYNTSEIIFTPRQLITKDRRIAVEFQYSDKNYARSLLQAHLLWDSPTSKTWLSIFSEQDSKNQPLQQELDDERRTVLANAGDDPQDAVISGIEQVSFSNDRVLYAIQDSLGYDSIFVWSTDPDIAVYRISFSLVGSGQGDYIEDIFTANGKVYKWIAPDTINNVIFRKGDYQPITSLVAPQKKQILVLGTKQLLPNRWEINAEAAGSVFDKNTFSSIDQADNGGFGAKAGIGRYKASDDSIKWDFLGGVDYEFAHKNFNPVERFRAVEFERNWNLLNRSINNNLQIAQIKAGLGHAKKGSAIAGFDIINAGADLNGLKATLFADLKPNKSFVGIDASFLSMEGESRSEFLRHRGNVYRDLKKIRLGFKDEHELNKRFLNADSLSDGSYQFYEWQSYVQTGDSSGTGFKFFYGGRNDRKILNQQFRDVAIASQYGSAINWKGGGSQPGALTISRRNLRLIDDSLNFRKPENTLIGRLEQRYKLGKAWLTGDLFYEIGSGLEQRRQFIYLEVPAGQGVYVWIDYNNDGVKDLNEFEIAQFLYEANYIRTFTPTDDYSRTYSNDFSTSMQFRPSALPWFKPGKNAAWLGLFSNQLAYKVSRKTLREDGIARFNPFTENLRDTVLLTQASNWRNILFFNRTNAIFGADYTYQQNQNKNLLANGFENRGQRFNQFRMRWSPVQKYTIELNAEEGKESSSSDFLSNRNYSILYTKTGPSLTWQPDNKTRLTADSRVIDKKNAEDLGGEKASIFESGIELRYNEAAKSSFQGNFRLIRIKYNSSVLNNSLSFEMLDGLRPGQNYTWSANWQRTLPGNLQISLLYNGRKSEEQKTIHSGGVQARAFF